jgi:thiol-disulfide isomerase/thioredoxin
MLIRALFRNEIGSLQEGPAIDSPAPDFRLQTQDGAEQIHLADRFDGTKPTVLVFGNFTCGPFRRMYPAVDEVCQLWKDDAHFLGVYVREAHPRDGWKMESNTRMGVDIPQPTNYEERKAVAQTCATTLKWSMPLVVDEIHDPVGSTYSGMPARLYVIDSQGKVAYKSGRGPFGFKAGEMEQALVMSLLETVLRDSK